MDQPATIGDIWAIVIGVPTAIIVLFLIAVCCWAFGNGRGWW
jgi:hypothetical protein